MTAFDANFIYLFCSLAVYVFMLAKLMSFGINRNTYPG